MNLYLYSLMGKFAIVESGIDNEIGSWKGSTSGRKQNLYWTGERVLWDMLIESKSDIRLLEGFVGKDWGWKWKWKGLVEQIDWQRLTHCLTLMPWPTWAFCLLFSEGLKSKKTKGLFFKKEKSPLNCVDEWDSPRESFSPESGGRVNPRTAMDAMRRQGTMRLKK